MFSLSVARVSPQMSSVMRVVFAIRHRRPNNNSSLGGRPVPPPAGVGVEVMVRIRDRIRISGVGTFMAGRVEGGRGERSATEAIRHESASARLCHGQRHDRLRAVGEHITILYAFVSERRIFVLWARGHWREAYRPIACKENSDFAYEKDNSERTTGPRSVPPNLPEIHARSRPGDRRRPRVVTSPTTSLLLS